MKRQYYTDLIFKILLVALGAVMIAGLVFVMCGCKPKQQIIERTLTDTIYKVHADTVRLISERVDSVVYRDSMFTIIKGDTVLIKEYHYRDSAKKMDSDTYKARTDTVWSERTVTEYKTQTVEVERKLRWWQKLLMLIGGFMVVVFVSYFIAKVRIYIKDKAWRN